MIQLQSDYIYFQFKIYFQQSDPFITEYMWDRVIFYNEVTLFRTFYYKNIYNDYVRWKLLNI